MSAQSVDQIRYEKFMREACEGHNKTIDEKCAISNW